MDIYFKKVNIIGITATNSENYLDVHLDDVEEDDLFDSIIDEVANQKVIDSFVDKMSCGEYHLSDNEKEYVLDSIGETFIRGYLAQQKDDK